MMDFIEKNLKLYELMKSAKDDVSEVASVAVCDGKSLLMGKRRDNQRWTCPGGHLNKGEEKEEGAARELFEETGIKVEKKDLKYLGSKDVTTYTGKKKKIHAFKYEHQGERPNTKHDPDKEVEKWEWVDCKNGIPLEVAENSHTPVDKNILFELLNLEPESIEKSEFLQKTPVVFEGTGEKPYAEVWRMQNMYGQGPYSGRNYHKEWADPEHGWSGMKNPTPGADKGFTEEDNRIVGHFPRSEGKTYFFGFEHLDHLNNWFSPAEQEKLSKLGFKPTKVKAKKVWSSGRQAFYEPYSGPEEEKLAASETAKQETEEIKENKKKSEAKRRHKFQSAQWTHPNGHPRCFICGDEERVGGMCEGVKIYKSEDIDRTISGVLKKNVKEKIPGGLASGKIPSDFPKEKVDEGMRVEMEHTRDPEMAKEIAMDHLSEDLDYYSKLKTIEKNQDQSHVKADFFDNSWQNSYLRHPSSQPSQPPQEDVPDIASYVIHNLMNRGSLIYHPKRGIIQNRYIANRGDGAPLMRSEEQMMTLHHFSPHSGLKEIDPAKMGTSGVQSGGQYKYGLPETKSSFFYREGFDPERVVAQGAKSKYKVMVPLHHLYDLGSDPEGIVNKSLKENHGAWNTDKIFHNIRQGGYKGIWAPSADHPVIQSTVQLFDPHPVHSEEVIHA